MCVCACAHACLNGGMTFKDGKEQYFVFLILHDEEKTWNQEFYFKFGKLEMSDLEVKLSLSFIRE